MAGADLTNLFKGTNVQDAMKCSSTVIRGLIKMKNSLLILSYHIFTRLGMSVRILSQYFFKYFETNVIGDQLVFLIRPSVRRRYQ